MMNRVRDVSLANSVYLIDDCVGRWEVRLMQWFRRVDDRIRHLVAQALASASPDRSVLSSLRTAIRQYGHRRLLKTSWSGGERMIQPQPSGEGGKPHPTQGSFGVHS